MRENIIEITNHLLSNTWLFIVIGIIHILIIEHEIVLQFIKQKSKNFKQLIPIFKRSGYIVLGVLFILLSYSIVNFLIDIIIPSSLPKIDYSNIQVNNFWSFVKYQSQYAGLVAVIGFIISGISLILSGGGKWLVNMSKLFITLSILYLIFTTFVAFS